MKRTWAVWWTVREAKQRKGSKRPNTYRKDTLSEIRATVMM